MRVTVRDGLCASPVVDCACRINKEHGIRGVYRGHQATLIRIFPYAALNYMGYEQYKRVSSSSSRRQQSMPRRALADASHRACDGENGNGAVCRV